MSSQFELPSEKCTRSYDAWRARKAEDFEQYTGKVFKCSIAFIICDRGKPLLENLSITLFKVLSLLSSAAVYTAFTSSSYKQP